MKQLTDGQTLTEEFTYTYTDADGDIATGSVTITINGVDNGVTVTPSDPNADSDKLTVYESGLEGGTQAGQAGAPTTAEGSLDITAPDGVKSIVLTFGTERVEVPLDGKAVTLDMHEEGSLSASYADGRLSYTYTLSDNTLEHGPEDNEANNISHAVGVTVTDADNTVAEGTITVNMVDDVPVVTPDTDDVTEGTEITASGNVADNDRFGADGFDHVEWRGLADGEYTLNGDKVMRGNEQVGTLTLAQNGSYTFTLDSDYDVPQNGLPDLVLNYRGFDADGDSADSKLTITISGDLRTPDIPVEPAENEAVIVVDEGALTGGSGQHTIHGVSGKGSFKVDLNGEDGTVTLEYGSGENSSITVSLINGDQFSRSWLSPNKTLTVNGVTVEVTRAEQQGDGSWKIYYEYTLTGQQAHTGDKSAGAVGEKDALSDEIDIKVTDATGDTTTGSLTVTVHDDGPVVALTGVASGMIVDESFASDEPSHSIPDVGGATATLEGAALFSVNGGADGVADMSYSLTVSNAHPKLVAIVDGKEYAVTLAVIDGEVQAVAGGKVIFTVSINEDTGTVTMNLTGNGSLKHPVAGNVDENLLNPIEDINVKLTVTDGDGDVTSNEAKLQIQVSDDGPVVTAATGENPSLFVDESALVSGDVETGVQFTTNVASHFTVNAGADGEGGRSYALVLDSTANEGLQAIINGQTYDVTLSLNEDGNRISGTAHGEEVFYVAVDAKGDVTLTLRDGVSLKHPEDTDPNDVLSLNGIGVKLTVTDNDGDSSSAEVGLNLSVSDDGPVVTAATGANPSLFVDESALVSGDVETGVQFTTNVASHFTVNAGADGEGGRSYALVLDSTANEGLQAIINGQTYDVTLSLNEDGNRISGTAHGEEVFYVAVDAKGDVTLTLRDGVSLKHSKATDPNDVLSLNGIGVKLTVTDNDGDSSSAEVGLNLSVYDDGPVVTAATGANPSLFVDESALVSGDVETGVQFTTNVASHFTVNAGADGEGGRSYALVLDSTANEGLQAIINGQTYDVTLSLNEDGNRISGTAHGEEVFYVAVDAKGDVTLTLRDGVSLKHSKATDPNDVLSLNGIGVKLTVTDNDGDSSSAEVGLNLSVYDDGPVVSVKPELTEAGNDTADSSISGTFTVDFGADGPSENAAITIAGQPVKLDGETIISVNDGTLKISKSGERSI